MHRGRNSGLRVALGYDLAGARGRLAVKMRMYALSEGSRTAIKLGAEH